MTALLPWERLGSKVSDRHLERLAVVYVRQSTRQQVVDHGESTRLQYGLVERAVGLGWPAEELTTPSSARTPRVSAIVKVTGIDHPVSPCSWLRSHALRRVQLDLDREGVAATELRSLRGEMTTRSQATGWLVGVAIPPRGDDHPP